MTRSFRFSRFTVFGSLVLGLVFAGLVPAGLAAVKYAATEENLRAFASQDGKNALVRQLLAQQVSPDAPEPSTGQTAVHKAAEGTLGKPAVKNLEALLQAGGDPNVQDREGNTPLHFASPGLDVFGDHVAPIRVLLQHHADPNLANAQGQTPLHVAEDTPVFRALLAAGAKPEMVDQEGLTALQRFVRAGTNNGEIVTLLVQAGAAPDRKDPRGDAPLHAAIKEGGSHGNAAVVTALLAGGADPCVQDDKGATPYHLSSGMQRIHRALARAGGDDASHAGDSGCKGLFEDDSKMAYEEGDGSEDDSEMTYEAELRALEERVEAERRAEAVRLEEARRQKAARRAEAKQRAKAVRLEEARRQEAVHRAEAKRRAEAARLEEARRQESSRRAAAARRAEEAAERRLYQYYFLLNQVEPAERWLYYSLLNQEERWRAEAATRRAEIERRINKENMRILEESMERTKRQIQQLNRDRSVGQ